LQRNAKNGKSSDSLHLGDDILLFEGYWELSGSQKLVAVDEGRLRQFVAVFRCINSCLYFSGDRVIGDLLSYNVLWKKKVLWVLDCQCGVATSTKKLFSCSYSFAVIFLGDFFHLKNCPTLLLYFVIRRFLFSWFRPWTELQLNL
jgi:hypothetical protein